MKGFYHDSNTSMLQVMSRAKEPLPEARFWGCGSLTTDTNSRNNQRLGQGSFILQNGAHWSVGGCCLNTLILQAMPPAKEPEACCVFGFGIDENDRRIYLGLSHTDWVQARFDLNVFERSSIVRQCFLQKNQRWPLWFLFHWLLRGREGFIVGQRSLLKGNVKGTRGTLVLG